MRSGGAYVDRDDRAFARQELASIGQQALAHVRADFGDEGDAMLDQQLLRQGLLYITPIAEELAKEAADQARHGAAVISIAWCETKGEQFAAVIDDQMEPEAVEPTRRSLVPARGGAKDAVLGDTRIMTGDQRPGIHETAPATAAQLGVQIDRERRRRRPVAICSRSQSGSNCRQNASTGQNRSSILIRNATRLGLAGC